MRLIFLAAGKGERIFKNFNINKPLIKIGKKRIIENLLLSAKKSKIEKISIVIGFKRKNFYEELKKYKNIEYVVNNQFNNTDMLHSLVMALKKYDEDLLFSYSDIIYESKILDRLNKTKSKHIIIPFIKNWNEIWKVRKKNIYEDVESFKIDNQKFLKEIGKKITKKTQAQGQFMGLIFIPNCFKKKILEIYTKHFSHKKIQTTQFLNFLIKKQIKIKCLEYNGEWYEIDDYNDYKFFINSNDFKRTHKDFKI